MAVTEVSASQIVPGLELTTRVVTVDILKWYTGSQWSAYPLKYWDGTAWVAGDLKYYNGIQWVGGTSTVIVMDGVAVLELLTDTGASATQSVAVEVSSHVTAVVAQQLLTDTEASVGDTDLKSEVSTNVTGAASVTLS